MREKLTAGLMAFALLCALAGGILVFVWLAAAFVSWRIPGPPPAEILRFLLFICASGAAVIGLAQPRKPLP